MLDIRTPEEKDRSFLIDLMRISFNASTAFVRNVGPTFPLSRFLVGFEDGRPVAMTQAWGLDQWFGGRPVPTAGIAAVAAIPERRGAGFGPEIVRAMLRKSRAEGSLFSTLYPSRASVYRRLGYEYAGALVQYRVPVTELPRGRCTRIEEMREADIPGAQSCYRAFAATQTGLVDCRDEDWWRLRILRRINPDLNVRAALVRGAGGVEGYATFQLDPQTETWGYRITCTHLVALGDGALGELLSYFRGFTGLAQHLAWYGPPGDPIGLLIGGGGEALQPVRMVRFMSRLLDVAGALEARGYPDVEGEATISVEDDLFPDNRGPFRIAAAGGRVSVERAARGAERPIPIGVLSSLFGGFATPGELVRAGILEPGPSLSVLARLFAGSPPWMTDFF